MLFLYTILIVPLIGVICLSLIGHKRVAGIVNIGFNLLNFAVTLFLVAHFLTNGPFFSPHQLFYVDAFNILFGILTTFTTTTIAIFSRGYMWQNLLNKRITEQQLRLYHIMYQLFVLMLLLALFTNNIGMLWVTMEGATLATVLLVSLYRTKEAVEAAWKYFILCIVGIALALFGTILFYASATHIIAPKDAILWSNLYQYAHYLNPAIIKLGFIFLLVGYGTKIGLVPMHHWLPDAYSESPAPVSALLAGLLSTVSLYALMRFKIIVNLTLDNNLAGNLMIGFGLLSFLYAAVMLHRQNNIKRLFAYSSIENMGLITFAFGINNPLATFGALFYTIAHSLIKSAIFITIGNVIWTTGTQKLDQIRGLIQKQPYIGWGLLLGTIAISGLPPFAIFNSEIMLFIATAKISPWLVLLLIFGLLIVLAGLFRNIHPLVYGAANNTHPQTEQKKSSMVSAILHLSMAGVLSFYLPPFLAQCLQQATLILTNK